MHSILRFAIATAVLVFCSSQSFSQTHPFSVQDLVSLKRLSEPALAPDESRIVFTLRETDLQADRGRTDLWLLDVRRPGSAPVRMTSHPENDSGAQWSGDGQTIYFLSSRSGTQQVWKLAASGGEAEQVTALPLDVGTFKVSRDGRQLALSLDVFPDCADLACTAKRNKERADNKARGLTFDRFFVRHWDTWDDGSQTHLFVMPLVNGKANGEPRDLIKSLDADVPSKPFGDASEYAFTPDGATLVFAARIKGKAEPFSTNFDLYEVSLADGALKNLTAANPAWDTQPIFSADGVWLAYRAMERPGFEADRFHIALVNRKSGERRALTKNWDRSVDTIEFAPDGKRIYALTDHLGQHALWSVDVQSGKPTLLVGQGHVDALSVGAKEIFLTSASLAAPADLFAFKNGKLKQLTRVNAAAMAQARLGAAEQFTFKGANDETVHAYLVTPTDFDATKKYPLAMVVHGGPQGSLANVWHYRWNAQTYAGAGFAYLSIDFHGSTGYGQPFTDSITRDWGGKPLVDLQKGLAAALEKYPWLDGGRVCALGGSYGGYMMNWIAGNWPAPFKCLVNHAGILDDRFMAYATEELWFVDWEHGGMPHTAPANFEQHNPINYVNNWRVPMLVIAGQKDYRVPYSQSIAAFNALQSRGVPSRLLVFPNENHWVLKPANSIQWHNEVERWLKQWTAPSASGAGGNRR